MGRFGHSTSKHGRRRKGSERRLDSPQRPAHPLDEGVELAIDIAAILGLRRLSPELDAYPGRGQLKPCGAGSALVPRTHPPASIDVKPPQMGGAAKSGESEWT
jgi:hypothetical protein